MHIFENKNRMFYWLFLTYHFFQKVFQNFVKLLDKFLTDLYRYPFRPGNTSRENITRKTH